MNGGPDAVGAYVLAFGVTWLIESIVYLWAFGSLGWLGGGSRLSIRRALLLVLGLNVATHPLLWWFTATVPGIGSMLAAEALAVLVEGTIIGLVVRDRSPAVPRRWTWGWAYLASLLANAVSLLAGLLGGLAVRALAGGGSSVCC